MKNRYKIIVIITLLLTTNINASSFEIECFKPTACEKVIDKKLKVFRATKWYKQVSITCLNNKGEKETFEDKEKGSLVSWFTTGFHMMTMGKMIDEADITLNKTYSTQEKLECDF